MSHYIEIARLELDCPEMFHCAPAPRLPEEYSTKPPGAHGHRAFDVLHVATALHLGAREILTFDASQRKLAVAEKLKTKL